MTPEQIAALVAGLEGAEVIIRALCEALGPFAACGMIAAGELEDATRIQVLGSSLLLGEFRRATAVHHQAAMGLHRLAAQRA